MGNKDAQNNVPIFSANGCCLGHWLARRKYNPSSRCLSSVSLQDPGPGAGFQGCTGPSKAVDWKLSSFVTSGVRHEAVRREKGGAGVKGRPEPETRSQGRRGSRTSKERFLETSWGGGGGGGVSWFLEGGYRRERGKERENRVSSPPGPTETVSVGLESTQTDSGVRTCGLN